MKRTSGVNFRHGILTASSLYMPVIIIEALVEVLLKFENLKSLKLTYFRCKNMGTSRISFSILIEMTPAPHFLYYLDLLFVLTTEDKAYVAHVLVPLVP